MAFNAFSAGQSAIQPGSATLLLNNPQAALAPHFNNQHAILPNQDQQAMQQQIQQIQQFQQQMQQMQRISHLMHPAMNDQPLEFNINKNKPPVAIVSDQSAANGGEAKRNEDPERRDLRDRESRRISPNRYRERRDRRDRDRDRERNERTEIDRKIKRDDVKECAVPEPSPSIAGTIPGIPMMNVGGMMGGMMSGMMAPGMVPMMDHSLMMGQYGMVPGLMPEGSIMPADPAMGGIVTDGVFPGQRTVLEFKECTLVPPSPMAPAPLTRDRPPGCRTVYVGGLPDNCTEEIIRDVFGRCGEMSTVRMSRKNFCHIRFSLEASVDAAMLYSGYRMRIRNNTDAANTGRLHVDYAQARVDQYDFECKQRALQRQARHRERIERDRLRPASPPPIPHYTDHEAGTISENIKTDEGFKKSVQTVIAWLERGDLSKRNATAFYAMIQSTHAHVRRLLNEKMQHEEELQNAKDLHRSRVHNIVVQFGFIEKIFSCASHKKCWDHFTKAQRKNIEAWKKQSTEIKQLQLVDGLVEEGDEEMDVSDSEDNGDMGPIRKRTRNDTCSLKEENDSLKCQLEAYKNEVDLVKLEVKSDMDAKDRQIKALQQTIQTMHHELTLSRDKLEADADLVKQLEEKVKTAELSGNAEKELDDLKVIKDEGNCVSTSCSSGPVVDKDAKLIGLISTFLHVHPFGAGLDYIWSYISKLDATVKVADVENLMSRYPGVFRQELLGIGASMERRWIFSGFETSQ